jgi:asparagine synthase (glutamine-hydrolysing)
LLMALLCKLVRQTRKVVLACQGADEPLGGYARHTVERLLPALHWTQPLLKCLPEALAASDRIARMRRIAAEPDEARRFAETLAIFGLEESVAMTTHPVESDSLADPVRRWLEHTTGGSFNRLLQIDSRLSLADDLLNVADQMSMASSVELRVPFLDLEFLALVEQMPARFKVSLLGERKWLYRKAVRPSLPEVQAGLTGWRARTGRKHGFSTPLGRWYPTWLSRDAESFLLGHESRTKDYLNGNRVRTLIEDARDRQRPRMRQLLTIYILEVWLRAQGLRSSRCDNGYEQLSRIEQ